MLTSGSCSRISLVRVQLGSWVVCGSRPAAWWRRHGAHGLFSRLQKYDDWQRSRKGNNTLISHQSRGGGFRIKVRPTMGGGHRRATKRRRPPRQQMVVQNQANKILPRSPQGSSVSLVVVMVKSTKETTAGATVPEITMPHATRLVTSPRMRPGTMIRNIITTMAATTHMHKRLERARGTSLDPSSLTSPAGQPLPCPHPPPPAFPRVPDTCW